MAKAHNFKIRMENRQTLRTLKNLTISTLPFCIKYRYLAAFMFSNDPSFGVIIKQLMANNAGDFKN